MYTYEHISFENDNERFLLKKVSVDEIESENLFKKNKKEINPGMLIWVKDSIYGKSYSEDKSPLADKSFGISEETRALVLVLENINIPNAKNSIFSYIFHEDFPGFLILFKSEMFFVRLEDVTGIFELNDI